MYLAEFVSRLRNTKTSGSSTVACCPAHDDRRASLSISEGDDGRLLLHCHAGCSTEAILAALGLAARDLFPERAAHVRARHREAATYDYTNEQGALVYQVVRFDPKDFRQRRPDAAGGWTWNLNGTARVLFRLERVLNAARSNGIVWIVEGEKDALRLEALGLIAATNAGGAGKWSPRYAEALKGARGVYVLPDNDAPGRKHAEDVAQSVHSLGIQAKVVELSGIPEKGDVSDWLDAGGTVEQLWAVARQAPLWEPKGKGETAARQPEDSRAVITKASEITPRPTRWVWADRFPAGMVSLVAGREGTGKSTMMIDRAARLTRGELAGAYLGTPRSVVVVAAEDSWAHTIAPRLLAAGADCDRVLRVQVRMADLGACEMALPDDVDVLRDVVRSHDVGLVVLDPLISRLSRRLDTHRDAEVRLGLEPLAAMADETGAAVVGLIHVSKAVTRDPLTSVMASRGFVAVARAVVYVAVDPDAPTIRVVGVPKCNVGPDDSSGLASLSYTIEGAKVETPEGPAGTSRVVWQGTPARGVREILAAAQGGTEEASALRVAEDWLRDLLADGPVASKEIQEQAKAAGVGWTTVRRAQGNLGIKPALHGFGRDGTWYWELPPARDAQELPEMLNKKDEQLWTKLSISGTDGACPRCGRDACAGDCPEAPPPGMPPEDGPAAVVASGAGSDAIDRPASSGDPVRAAVLAQLGPYVR